jgi:hypothetical protein
MSNLHWKWSSISLLRKMWCKALHVDWFIGLFHNAVPSTELHKLEWDAKQQQSCVVSMQGRRRWRSYHEIGLWGYQTVHCVGGVEQRMKPLPTFDVNVKLWLHPYMCIWATFWSQRTSKVCLGTIRNFCKVTGLPHPTPNSQRNTPHILYSCFVS